MWTLGIAANGIGVAVARKNLIKERKNVGIDDEIIFFSFGVSGACSAI